jgi:hypothetical protein
MTRALLTLLAALTVFGGAAGFTASAHAASAGVPVCTNGGLCGTATPKLERIGPSKLRFQVAVILPRPNVRTQAEHDALVADLADVSYLKRLTFQLRLDGIAYIEDGYKPGAGRVSPADISGLSYEDIRGCEWAPERYNPPDCPASAAEIVADYSFEIAAPTLPPLGGRHLVWGEIVKGTTVARAVNPVVVQTAETQATVRFRQLSRTATAITYRLSLRSNLLPYISRSTPATLECGIRGPGGRKVVKRITLTRPTASASCDLPVRLTNSFVFVFAGIVPSSALAAKTGASPASGGFTLRPAGWH